MQRRASHFVATRTKDGLRLVCEDCKPIVTKYGMTDYRAKFMKEVEKSEAMSKKRDEIVKEINGGLTAPANGGSERTIQGNCRLCRQPRVTCTC